MMTRHFEPASRALFFKSPRLCDSRWGEYVSQLGENRLASIDPSIVLVGYPDDDGIRVNFGRLGSKEAPDAIRTALYKLAPTTETPPSLYDVGNLIIAGDIRERHARAMRNATAIFENGHRLMSFGGGNDYAYPDAAAFVNHFKNGIVVNIDSHFDLRPEVNGPNSGTPFFQLLENHKHFTLHEVGIQNFANSPYFFSYAKGHRVHTHLFSECHGNLKKVFKKIGKKRAPLFLAVDLDAFSSAFAPGVSAPHPIGLDANEFYLALDILFQTYDVKGIGFYEVSPPHDRDSQTAKLAAAFAHKYLSFHGNKNVSKKQSRK